MLEGVANFLPFCGVFWKVKILLEIIEGNTLRADLLFFLEIRADQITIISKNC